MGRFCALFLFSAVHLFGNVNQPSLGQPQVIQSTDQVSDQEKDSSEVMAVEQQKVRATEEASLKAAPVKPDEPQSFKLMPHKAIYEIQLRPRKKPNDPTVRNVTGRGSIELVKTKEGWVYNQNLEVQIHYYDGTTTTIERNIASWESPTEVSFHIENFRDGASESLLQGGAELTEEGGWRVYFQKPEMDGFITDQHLVFPIGHLEKILEIIEKGKNILSDQIVFDATYEVHEPVRINTIITPLKDKKVELKDNSLLPSSKIWRLQEALYDLQSSNPVPDYEESNIDLFSTGVISAMETTWGEGITVVLKLKELTVYQ